MADFKKFQFILLLIFLIVISMNFITAADADDNSTISQDMQITEEYQSSLNTEIYVDPNFNGASDGSKDSPYKSIQSALDSLDGKHNSTVILKNGTYVGEANTKVSLIGNLIVKADEGANPTVDGGATNKFWTLTGSNILLKGITFSNFNGISSNQGIITSFNIENLTVSQCKFEKNTQARAIYLDRLNNTVIDGCTFQDNDMRYLSGGGVYSQYLNNLTFSNNKAINHNSYYSYDGGILYSIYNNNVTVIDNKFCNVSAGRGSGIYLSYGKKAKLENNYFDNVGGVTSSYNGRVAYIYSSGDIDIINNTVINSKGASSGSIYVSQNNGNVNITGNDFKNNSDGLYVYMSNSFNLTFNDNDFINTSSYYGGRFSYISFSNSGDLDLFNNKFINSTYNSLYVSISSSRNVNITSNDFINCSYSSGYAVYFSMSSSDNITLTDNNFINCSSYYSAMYMNLYRNSEGIIEGNEFINCSSKSDGGSLYLSGSLNENLTIENNNFINSLVNGGSSSSGGAIYTNLRKEYNLQYKPTVSIKNNNFVNSSIISSSTSSGGAIYVYSYSGNNAIYANVANNTFINSYSRNGGAIYASIYDSIIYNNTIINSSSLNQGGSIYLSGNNNVISNHEFSNSSSAFGGAIYINGNNNRIIDNIFSNNTANSSGGAIYSKTASNTLIINNKFDSNNAKIGGAVFFDYYQTYPNIYQNNNNSIINSTFINNEAETAGAVVLYSSNSIISNSTFIGNNATRYGSGAISSGGRNNVITNNLFENNTAFLYAGAIGTNDTAIINNTFTNNSAFQAGAILTINSTIENNTFADNFALRGINIAYVGNWKYGDNILLRNNKGLNEDTVFAYDENQIINVYKELNGKFYLYDNIKTNSGTFSFQGYCIEQDASIPIVPSNIKYNGTWGILVDDLFFVRNSLDQSYVGDYLKVLIMKYQNYENYNIKDLIYVFTDGDYRNSRDPIIQDVIKLAENCFTILQNGNNTIEGKIYPCEFYTFINPTTRQNLIIWNCTNPIVIPTLSPSKTLVESKTYKVGDNVTFRITVANDKNFTFHNVTIRENTPSGFSIVDWINTYSDEIERVSNNVWILKRDLKPGEKVQFDVILRFDRLYSNNPSNYIYVESLESDSQSAYVRVPIETDVSNLIITKIPSKNSVSFPEGSVVYFDVKITNPGPSKYAQTIYIRDYWSSDDYKYLRWQSDYNGWGVGQINDGEVNLYYSPGLAPGESVTVRLFYEAKYKGASGNRYNNVVLNGNQNAQAYYYIYTRNTGVFVGKAVQGPNPSYVGSRVQFYLYIRNTGGGYLHNAWIEEKFPDEWVYDGWSGSNDWIHVITETGAHRWIYTKPLTGYQGFNVYFNMTKAGNYTNVAIGGADDFPNSTVSILHTVVDTNLKISKYVQGPNPTFVGARMPFYISVANTGSLSVNNVWIEEKFPDEWVYDGWSGSSDWVHVITETGAHRWIYTKPLSSGPQQGITVFFNMTKAGNYTNVAVLGVGNVSIRNVSYNQLVLNDTIQIDKYSMYTTYDTSSMMIFPVVIRNNIGFSGGLTNVWFEEHFPKEFIYDHWEGSSNWILNISENGVYRWTYNGIFPAGPTHTVYIFFRPTITGNFTNTVIGGAYGNINKTSSVNVTVTGADIKLEKITNDAYVELGNQVSFTIRLTNVGTGGTGGMYVREISHPGLIYDHYTTSDIYDRNGTIIMYNSPWRYQGNESWQYQNSFNAGQVTEFTVYYNTTEEGLRYNEIQSTFNGAYPRYANNTTFVYVANSNIDIQKITLDPEVWQGDNVTFTIVVKNTGEVSLTGVTVTEQFDDNILEYMSFNGTNWTYDPIHRIFKLNQTLAVNQTSSFNVTFRAKQNGTAINTVTVFANQYGNKTTSNVTFIKVANCTVEKLLLNKTVTIGDEIVYTVVVTNNGNSPLTNVSVFENYPGALEFVGVNSGWSSDDNRTFVYDDVLAPGGNAILNITFKAIGEGNITNTAVVTSDEKKVNISANNTVFVINPKLDVQKVSLNQSVNINETVIFTIVVTNNGNVNLTNITLNEKYPSGLEFIKFEGNWTTENNMTFIHNGLLRIGDSIELNITFKAVEKGVLKNIVTVKSNESSEVSAYNTTFVKAYEFTVEKLLLNKTVILGDTIVYTIIVSNTGTVPLTNVSVFENYPGALEFVGVNSGWSSGDNRTFVYDDVLAAGGNAILNITFKAVTGGNVTNVAVVTSNETESKSVNNTTFVKDYRYIVEKIAVDKVVSIGDDITYIIKVTNLGNCNLTSIKVAEKYSSDLQFKSFRGDWTSDDNRTFISSKTLESGKSSILSITFKVLGKDNITNPIEVSTNENKTNIITNETIFSKNPSIHVDKITVNDTVYVGEKTAFDIVVTNNGNVDLDNIVLTEDYPAEIILDSYSGNGWIRNGNLFTYNGVLKPGKTVKLRIVFNTTVGGEFINEVTVRSNNVSDSSCNITKVIYKQKPTPVNPLKPVKPVIKPILTPPFKIIPVKHSYHIDKHEENKLPGGGIVLSKHPTANPFGILLLMILILCVICLIRVKSINVEINNRNFLYLMLVVLLVFVSTGCAVAAEVDDSTDDLAVSAEEVIVVESSDVEEEVVNEYDEEVVVEYSDSADVQYEYADEVVIESNGSDVLSASNADNVYQAPQESIIYVNPDAGTTGDGSYSNPYNSINSALNSLDSSNSNTIVLMDGIYKGNENINLSNIPGNIIMMADNNANPIVDFENTANNWNFIGSHVMLNGITFTNANNSNGIISTVGNVNNYSIVGCSFISNINSTLINFNSVSEVSISQCNFTSNLATADDKFSIISNNSANVSLTSNNIYNQQYNSAGGVINADNVNNLEFSKNHLNRVFSLNGGAVYGNNINNLQFNENSVSYSGCNQGSGGALYLTKSKGDIIIHNNDFCGDCNTSKMGGALYLDVQPSKLSIKDNLFDFPNSFKTSQGQGIYLITKNCENVDIVGNIFMSCTSSGYGGAVYLESDNDKINITDNLFFASSSQYSGGSIYLYSQYSDVNLINNEFRGGQGSGSNVYLYVPRGDVVVKNNVFNETIASNRALYVTSTYGNAIMENNLFTGPYSYGGSAYITHSYNGYLSVLNNKFVNNYVTSNTGGSLSVGSYYADRVDVVGNEFINSTGSTGGSAYLSLSYSNKGNIENNTFVNSKGTNGGSLYIYSPYTSLSLKNNVFENSASYSSGGSIYINSYSDSNIYVIENNTIVNSSALNYGGSIYLDNRLSSSNKIMNVDINNNRIINSSSKLYGGTIYWSSSVSYSSSSANYNFKNNSITNSSGSLGGAIYTSFTNAGASNKDQFNVLNNNFTNTISSTDAGAIYFNSGLKTNIINNNFVNSSSDRNGGVLYMSNSYKDCSIVNNEFINGFAKNGGALYLIGNNYYISNNEFENNTATLYGGSIFSQKTSNDVFDNNKFVNGSAQMGGAIFIDYPQNYGASASNIYENKNITISNSEFNNNSAELGGAVVVYSDDTIVFNSTFTNNNATRYGSGALVSGGKNSKILNNTFENNTAFLYGGAIGTNNSSIINNTFISNSAYQAGAIFTINSTIVNNTFVDNEAKRGANIVYLDKYNYKTKEYDALLFNNKLSEGSVYEYNSTSILNVDHEILNKYFLDKVTGGYLYEGYCIEKNASIPLRNNGTYGILIDDLSFVRNSLDQSYVGDYIKLLFINSKINEDFNINRYVTIFTDTEYWNSSDSYIRGIINSAKSMTFNEDNTVVVNKTIYQFQTFVNPTTRQNLILMNSSEIVEIPELSISKIPDKNKAGLNEVIKFTVNVTNKKNMTVNNLVVSDILPAGLSLVSVDNSNGTWESVTSTSWKLNRALKPFETVQLNINVRVNSNSYATRTNTVTAKIDELAEVVQATSTVNIKVPSMKINKYLDDSVGVFNTYYPGETIKFFLNVQNAGEGDATSVTLVDSYPSQLEYAGFISYDKRWSFQYDSNNLVRFSYNGIFKAGQTSTLEVAFVVKDSYSSTSATNWAEVYLNGLRVDYSSVNFKLGSPTTPNFSLSKTGPSYSSIGNQFSYNIKITGVSPNIKEFYVDEIFPSEWEYISDNAPKYFIHSVVGPNHHRWTFNPTQSDTLFLPYSDFSVVFKSNTPGHYTNKIVGFAKGVGEKTASADIVIHGSKLSIEKLVQNSEIFLGDQVTFTIRVNNTGDGGAYNFYVNELPGPGLIFDHIVDGTNRWIYENNTSRIRYNGVLGSNDSAEVNIVFNTTKHGIITNIAQLIDPYTNQYASNTIYVQNHELSVEKWYLNFYNTYGQNTTFVIRVKNTGNMNLTNVFVEESQFDGLNYLNFTNVKGEWSVVENNGKYLFKLKGILTPGEIAEFDVLFNTTAHGKLTNIVVAGSSETENITANASVVSGNPSIEVEKITLNKTVNVGEEVTFTINVKNTGTMPLYGITVKEEFPDNLEYVSSTGKWVYDSKNRVFRLETALSACEPDNLESFNVTFRALKPGNVTNIINVTNEVVNVTANDTVYINNPNFTVQKVVVNKYVVPGDEVYFTVTVTNTGDMNLTDIRLKEIYPDALEFLRVVGNWDSDDNITFKFNGILPIGNSTDLTLVFKAVYGYNATNVVEVYTNETKWNKTSNDTVFIELYDFEVEKLALNKTVMKGDNVIYTVIITNTGNRNLTQIRIAENYSAGLQFVSVNEGWKTSDNKTFNYVGSLLKPGEKAILNITFKTIAGGNMTNVVVARSNETEEKTANNNTTYVINPEISVEKLTLNKTVDIGEEVQFTIVVNNTGNVDLDKITLVENYDGKLEFVGITSEGWNTLDNITFVFKDKLAVGDVAVLNITFKALEGGNAINIVEVTTNETSGSIANNTTLIKRPDFKVEKLLLNSSVKVNDTVVYSVVVTNTGNIDLTNITVVEEYPDSLQFVSNSPNWQTGDNRIFTFIGSVAPGSKAILNITFKAIEAGNVTNIVTATTNETKGNKSANVTEFVKNLEFIATKVGVDKIVLVGDETTFIINVTNLGNVDMKGIKVYENYPSSLKYVFHEGDWDTSDFREFTLTSSLAPGKSTTLNITFKVVSMGNITNPIDVVFEDENKTANDTIISIKAEVTVDKISLNRTAYVGNQSGFDIIVTNTGNVDLTNVTLFEDYPNDLIYDSFIDNNWTQSGNEFKYSGILKVGESIRLSVLFNTTKVGVFKNNVGVKASVNNLSAIKNITDEIVEKLSNNLTDNSSNITKVNIVYPEPKDPEPVTPQEPQSPVETENPVKPVIVKDKSKDLNKFTSTGEKSKSELSLESKATGNPLMLLALIVVVLILPLRRKK